MFQYKEPVKEYTLTMAPVKEEGFMGGAPLLSERTESLCRISNSLRSC